MDAHTRFLSKVSTDCWSWTGRPNSDGYGTFYETPTTKWLAHRWAYVQANGPIPDGYEIDHLCNVPICVRPDHLEAVSPEQNNARRAQRRDSCKRGHPYAIHGGIRKGNGRRYCKECHRLYTRARRNRGDELA